MNYKIDSQAASLRSIDMIIESLPYWVDDITVVIFVIVAVIFGSYGLTGLLSSEERKDKFVSSIIIAVVLLIISGGIFQNVPSGNVGLDEYGNWYEPGDHFGWGISIMNVPLAGSINVAPQKDLAYNLSQKEVILLASGSYFPEHLRDEIIIRYDKWDVSLENVPPRVDASHLKLVVSFNSSFLSLARFLPAEFAIA